mgnify:CR=1 FL=1
MFFIASNGLDPIKAAGLFCVVGAGTAEGVGAAPACATTGGGVVAATGSKEIVCGAVSPDGSKEIVCGAVS